MKNVIGVFVLCLIGTGAFAQDSMNKKMNNSNDRMIKKMENKTDKMNKKLENAPPNKGTTVDSPAKRSRPKARKDTVQ